MRQKLIDYIHTMISEDYDPEEDELIDYLDSVSFLQLTVAIEQLCGIALNFTAIDLDDFETIDTLVEMLEEKSGAAKV